MDIGMTIMREMKTCVYRSADETQSTVFVLRLIVEYEDKKQLKSIQ